MSLKAQLQYDLREATRMRRLVEIIAIRLTLSAVHNEEIRLGRTLTDQETQEVILKGVKQRRESIEQFGNAGRTDLVEKETVELECLQRYLEVEMTPEQLREALTRFVIQNPGVGKGPLTGMAVRLLKGKAEGKAISLALNEILEKTQ